MKQIDKLSDDELDLFIYQKIVSVSELKSLLFIDGVITNNSINQDVFANHFTKFIESKVPNNNINWAIPYFIADDIMEYVNDN